MFRLFEIVKSAVAVFGAAVQASNAVRQHRMPSEASLAALGINAHQMRKVKL